VLQWHIPAGGGEQPPDRGCAKALSLVVPGGRLVTKPPATPGMDLWRNEPHP